MALGEGEGFIKVTGEVGTGKTLICRALLKQLDSERYQLAYLLNILANKALMAAYGEGRKQVTPRHVHRAMRDTDSVQPAPCSSRRRIVMLSLLLAAAVGFGLIQHGEMLV